ncbi:MAG: HD domain-containing phosphohydrolase [Planctomycetota bacterium]
MSDNSPSTVNAPPVHTPGPLEQAPAAAVGLLQASPFREPADTVTIDAAQKEIRSAKIMIVDDEQLVIRVVKRFLASDGYKNFVTTTDPRQAVDRIIAERPDVVLLDINMPHINGLELLKIRQRTPECQHVPFIILSANSETETKREALQLGATEFLNKPVDPFELVLRVQNALIVKRHHDHLENYAEQLVREVQRRTAQIERSREQIIHCLAKAAEYRDNETGEHVIRVGKYSHVVAQQLGFSKKYCRQIELAAQLHDVGKIGIPDSILLNPGKLTGEEFEVMKKHCGLGCEIMGPLAQSEVDKIQGHSNVGGFIMDIFDESPMLEMAAVIARTHHEKWDGSGYPNQLKGDQIPIEGRIVCVADVYDALCSERPYKPKFPIKKCLEIMLSERGTRFDPIVLDAFFERIRDIEDIRREYSDAPTLKQSSAPAIVANDSPAV